MSKGLRFAFFSHSDQLGGAERSLLSLVEDLIHYRNSTCAVILPGNGPLSELLHGIGATVVQIPLSWWCGGRGLDHKALLHSLAKSISGFFEVLPAIEEFAPDVIVTQTMVIPWGAAAAAALRKPHIWGVCEYGELDHGLEFIAPVRKIASDILASSDFVFVNSRDVQRALFPDVGTDRCDTLIKHIEITESPTRALHQKMRGHERVRLGLFGTMAPSKGQTDALEATSELTKRGFAVELVLAGGGDPNYVNTLKDLASRLDIQDRVEFAGFLIDPYPAMKSCDILLVCSRREAFGRVAAEAMLLGKPLVYPLSGGVAEFVQHEITGLGYAPGDAHGLAKQIERLVLNPQYAQALGQRAAIEAKKTFTRESYGAKFLRKAIDLSAAPYRTKAAFPSQLQPALHLAAMTELQVFIKRLVNGRAIARQAGRAG